MRSSNRIISYGVERRTYIPRHRANRYTEAWGISAPPAESGQPDPLQVLADALFRQRLARLLRVILALLILALAIAGVGAARAEAAPTAPVTQSERAPYGGCNEATLAPQSEGAQWCRDHGWTVVGHRLVVGPHGVLRGNGLPACPYEDGSRVTPRCIWLGDRMGNGYGLSMYYLAHKPMQPHYIWLRGPARSLGWEWVTAWHGLADALAEGGGLHDDTRDWGRCKAHVGPTTYVRCADGHREVS